MNYKKMMHDRKMRLKKQISRWTKTEIAKGHNISMQTDRNNRTITINGKVFRF
jgi:hypothetical protein